LGINSFHKILVTGGAGFIGRHLSAALQQAGVEIRVLDNLSTGTPDNLFADTELLVGDVRNRADVHAAVADVDCIIHLASVVGMRLAADEANLAYDVAVNGTTTVLNESGAVPVVIASSSAVYGLDDGATPRAEADALDYRELLVSDGGHRGYVSGKWQKEALGMRAARSGRAVMIVRPFNVVGPGQTGLYGMVLPNFIRQALAGTALTVFDDGEQTRSFSCVHSFAATLLRLLACPHAWLSGSNIVNIGNPQATRIIDLACLVIAATDSSSGIEFVPYQEIFPGRRDTRARRPDCNRLEELIGPTDWPAIETVVDGVVAATLSPAITQ
jgi:UDP-glucose 4-epimerase